MKIRNYEHPLIVIIRYSGQQNRRSHTDRRSRISRIELYFILNGITISHLESGTSGSMDYIFQSRRLRMLRILHRWSEAFHTLATGQPRRVISILVLKSCRKIYNAAFFLSWFCHISVIPVKPPDTAICPHVLWYTFTGLHFLRDIDSSAVRSVPRSVHYVSCLSS